MRVNPVRRTRTRTRTRRRIAQNPVRRTRTRRRAQKSVKRNNSARKRTLKRKQSTKSSKSQHIEVNDHINLGKVNNLLKKKRPALILFYANWCHHCQAMKPEWEKLEELCGRIPGNKMVVKVNSDFKNHLKGNLADISRHVVGYPSIFQVKGNRLVRYGGERDHVSFINALKGL
tara:strand:+ start:128 stop:649 length:522 start_codon:yes stop_codon:yes gene_type:complete